MQMTRWFFLVFAYGILLTCIQDRVVSIIFRKFICHRLCMHKLNGSFAISFSLKLLIE